MHAAWGNGGATPLEWFALALLAASLGSSMLLSGRAVTGMGPAWKTVAGTYVVAAALAMLTGALRWQGLISLAIFAAFCIVLRSATRSSVHRIALVCVIAMTLLFGFHGLPGFALTALEAPSQLCEGCATYKINVNADKTSAGALLLLLCLAGTPVYRTWRRHEVATSCARSAALAVIAAFATAALIYTATCALGFTRWAPKLPEMTLTFLFTNLFFTTIPEEAFFRGFLHTFVYARWSQSQAQSWRLVLISGAVFGIAHGGTVQMFVAATVAGCAYAYVYERTRRIEWAVLTHFALNCVHFFLFSYPYLTSY